MRVCVCVCGEGEGLTREKLKRYFDDFRQYRAAALFCLPNVILCIYYYTTIYLLYYTLYIYVNPGHRRLQCSRHPLQHILHIYIIYTRAPRRVLIYGLPRPSTRCPLLRVYTVERISRTYIYAHYTNSKCCTHAAYPNACVHPFRLTTLLHMPLI